MDTTWIESKIAEAKQQLDATPPWDNMWETYYRIWEGYEMEMWDEFPA